MGNWINSSQDPSQNSGGNSIYVSGSDTKYAISVSNNKAQYYAQQAGSYATAAETSATLASEYLASVQAVETEAVSVIDSKTEASLGSIQTAATDSLSSISAASTEGASIIDSKTSAGLGSITTAATEATSAFTVTYEEAMSIIQSTTESSLSTIGSSKTETLTTISGAKTDAVSVISSMTSAGTETINSSKTSALTTISGAKTEALTTISGARTEALSTIGSAKTDALSTINTTGTSYVNTMTALLGSTIASATLAEDWATKMDGTVDGTEYSAKYYAQQATTGQIQANWNEANTASKAYIQNKPTIGAANTTILVNSTSIGTINANQTTAGSVNILVPTDNASLANGAGYITSSALSGYALSSDIPTDNTELTNGAGYITGITSTMVTNALGYTPYNSSNPNGYTSNAGTVTKVNNTSPDSGGNVTISIPSEVTESTVSGWGFTKNAGTVTSVNNVLPVSGNVTLEIFARNIGEIVASTIPLTDAGLHLLDGALISGSGSYSAFVTYIAGLYNSGDYTAIFDTEANWQAAVTANGVCGKFVYDSVNNTVRLPKYSNKIYTGGGTAPVVGTGISLGLTDGTSLEGIGEGANGIVGHYTGNYGKAVGLTNASGNANNSLVLGVTTDGTKSGVAADLANITTSLDGYYYIVVANSTKTQIEVDIDEIATDLNGKADVDLSNINASASAKNTIVNWGMPDYANGISLVSLITYTCPSDGYILCCATAADTTFYRHVFLNGSQVGTYCRASNISSSCTFPVFKNDVVTSTPDFYGTVAKFYPMKGAS